MLETILLITYLNKINKRCKPVPKPQFWAWKFSISPVKDATIICHSNTLDLYRKRYFFRGIMK